MSDDARTVPCSVLDLAPIGSGHTATETLRNSTDLARTTERLGYRRYWLAEHHNMPGIASPSPALDTPYAMVAAAVICADDDAHAHEVAKPGGLSFLRLRQGNPGPLPSPAEAAAYPYSELERSFVADRLGSQIIGDKDSVTRQLDTLLADTAADELMITSQVYDHTDRIRSYELLAELQHFAPDHGRAHARSGLADSAQ